MTKKTDFTFLSSDGRTRLHGISWVPEGAAPAAVLQIVHGVAEHIDRYDGFARFLNGHGVIVVGHDHLGHGRSLTEGGTPAYFGRGNTWNTPVDDIYVLHTRIREQYPDLPLLLMGHGHPTNGNPAYQRLRQRLPEQVYLACLSGADNLTALLPELLSQPARRITLEPLLMSVGGHTLRDMAGDEPDSWKSQLEKVGFTVDCHLTGMGRLEIAQRIYARKLRSLIG